MTINDSSITPISLNIPLVEEDLRALHTGVRVLISGAVYTARDAAHKRLVEAIKADQPLPIPLEGQVIYYVGPSPAKPGQVIGSAGPTTAIRMDPYTPILLERGLKATIGKGYRGETVREAMIHHGAVYCVTVGGAAALVAEHIKAVEVVAYEDLGMEAIRRLEVDAFPVVVANDVHGGDLFEEARAKYRQGATTQ